MTPEANSLIGEDPGETYSIRDLCDAFGATPRALRFYEDQGLLNPKRDDRRRIYTVRDRARLKLILRGKRFGFTLNEIRELLDLYDLGDGQVTQLRRTIETAQEKHEMLKERRRELDEAIADLERHMDLVRRMLGERSGGAARPSKAVEAMR
ncbi:MAG: MerR family DNA-binding transcriptional regulator [Pseudomonadota bacterium]